MKHEMIHGNEGFCSRDHSGLMKNEEWSILLSQMNREGERKRDNDRSIQGGMGRNGMVSNFSFPPDSPLPWIPETVEAKRDLYGFQPLQMVVSFSIFPSALLLVAQPLLHFIIFLGLRRPLLQRGRGGYLRNIGRFVLLVDAVIIVANLANFLPDVISGVKVSINGQPLNEFYIYTLFLVFFFLAILAGHIIVERLGDMIGGWPDRVIIYCFVLYIIFGIFFYLHHCFISTRDNAEPEV
ncbi:hypothetical protein PFISCL1PPCAC_24538, partial [Pristionchus fissidentatus]